MGEGKGTKGDGEGEQNQYLLGGWKFPQLSSKGNCQEECFCCSLYGRSPFVSASKNRLILYAYSMSVFIIQIEIQGRIIGGYNASDWEYDVHPVVSSYAH